MSRNFFTFLSAVILLLQIWIGTFEFLGALFVRGSRYEPSVLYSITNVALFFVVVGTGIAIAYIWKSWIVVFLHVAFLVLIGLSILWGFWG